MIHTLFTLIRKEFTCELRKKSVIAGISLYLLSLIYICYLAFNFGNAPVSASLWAALYWLTMLFSFINTVAKSFIGEKKGVSIYLYNITSAGQIIISKIIYSSILCLALSICGFALFHVLLPVPNFDYILFVVSLLLVCVGFAACLSLISAIASRTHSSNVIMAVLSFPVIIGLLMMAIKITKNVLDNLDSSANYDEVLNLIAIDAIVITLSYLLFPFVWRS